MKPSPLAFAAVILVAEVAVSAPRLPWSAEAERAKCQFEAGQWAEAAVAFDRAARGETGDVDRARERARFYLGISLHRLSLHDASLRVFAAIAASRDHDGFHEARRFLVALDEALPEPAGVAAAVRNYAPRPLALAGDAERGFESRLNYLIGVRAYDDRRFEDAARAFDEVDPSSVRYLAAQLRGGLSFVNLRKSVPAVTRFKRMAEAVDDRTKDPEKKRLRDLAWMSMARTNYSASIRVDPPEPPTVNTKSFGSSTKYWTFVTPESPFWPDAQLESAWAHFMNGDYPRALGALHDLESGYVEATLYPEADVLRGILAFTICQYDEMKRVTGRSRARYVPIRHALLELAEALDAEPDRGVLAFYERARGGRAKVPVVLRPIVDTVARDRPLQRHLDYLAALDLEASRLRALPPAFRQSHLGGDLESGLARAREAALHGLAARVRLLLRRFGDDLDKHISDVTTLFHEADEHLAEERRRGAGESVTWGRLPPDVEHTIWPFDGEYWRDELGSYRSVLVSRCGR